MSEILDVDIANEEGNDVKVEVALAPDQIGPDGRALEISLIALGHSAIRRASMRGQSTTDSLRVIGLNTLFIAGGTGDRLYATASQVESGGAMTTWRATLFQGSAAHARSQWSRVAEMTQIQLNDANASSRSGERLLEPMGSEAGTTYDEAAPEDAGSTSAQRRKQIFRGALKVIGKKGYGAATIREIAAAAKLPIPTMYQYIKSKEDILYMITSGCMEDLIEVFQENLSQKRATKDRLTRAISAYVDYIEINRRYINLVYRETRSLSRDNREKIFEIERQFTGFWRKILEDGKASGEIDVSDANLTANFIYFLCTVWALRYWNIDQYSTNVIKRELTEFILRGLGAGVA